MEDDVPPIGRLKSLRTLQRDSVLATENNINSSVFHSRLSCSTPRTRSSKVDLKLRTTWMTKLDGWLQSKGKIKLPAKLAAYDPKQVTRLNVWFDHLSAGGSYIDVDNIRDTLLRLGITETEESTEKMLKSAEMDKYVSREEFLLFFLREQCWLGSQKRAAPTWYAEKNVFERLCNPSFYTGIHRRMGNGEGDGGGETLAEKNQRFNSTLRGGRRRDFLETNALDEEPILEVVDERQRKQKMLRKVMRTVTRDAPLSIQCRIASEGRKRMLNLVMEDDESYVDQLKVSHQERSYARVLRHSKRGRKVSIDEAPLDSNSPRLKPRKRNISPLRNLQRDWRKILEHIFPENEEDDENKPRFRQRTSRKAFSARAPKKKGKSSARPNAKRNLRREVERYLNGETVFDEQTKTMKRAWTINAFKLKDELKEAKRMINNKCRKNRAIREHIQNVWLHDKVFKPPKEGPLSPEGMQMERGSDEDSEDTDVLASANSNLEIEQMSARIRALKTSNLDESMIRASARSSRFSSCRETRLTSARTAKTNRSHDRSKKKKSKRSCSTERLKLARERLFKLKGIATMQNRTSSFIVKKLIGGPKSSRAVSRTSPSPRSPDPIAAPMSARSAASALSLDGTDLTGVFMTTGQGLKIVLGSSD